MNEPQLTRRRKPQLVPASMVTTVDIDQAEAAALGCCLLDNSWIRQLEIEWFQDVRLREVAGAVLRLASEAVAVDVLTLSHALVSETRKLGDVAPMVSCLPDACSSAANFPAYAGILNEHLIHRRSVAVAEALKDSTLPREMIAKHLAELQDALKPAIESEGTGMKALVQSAIDRIEAAHENQGKPAGIITGFPDMDRKFCGLREGQLVVIAARPGVGKTALALTIADHVATECGLSTVVVSLEMSAAELMDRMFALRSRVPLATLRDGSLTQGDFQKLTACAGRLRAAPLSIIDRGVKTVADLEAECRAHPARLIVIDYLQLLRAQERSMDSRYHEVTEISNALKRLAMSLRVPVVCLAQLNRESDKGERAPRMSDLRDSGAIEQDADIICLLHPDRDQESSVLLPTRVIVAKNRSGPTGEARLVLLKEITRFETAMKE